MKNNCIISMTISNVEPTVQQEAPKNDHDIPKCSTEDSQSKLVHGEKSGSRRKSESPVEDLGKEEISGNVVEKIQNLLVGVHKLEKKCRTPILVFEEVMELKNKAGGKRKLTKKSKG